MCFGRSMASVAVAVAVAMSVRVMVRLAMFIRCWCYSSAQRKLLGCWTMYGPVGKLAGETPASSSSLFIPPICSGLDAAPAA